jgi:Holliday junction resolvase
MLALDKPKRKVSHRGSKNKGSTFEREIASYLNETMGLESRRALLSGGGRNDGGADLDGTPLIHVEAKRTETFSPYAAMVQAETAIGKAIGKAKDKVMPVVIQRRNNVATARSLVVMRAEDWVKMYAAYLQAKGVALERDKSDFMELLNSSKNAS